MEQDSELPAENALPANLPLDRIGRSWIGFT